MVKRSFKRDKKTKRLVVLDAHAVLHRAYHALPDFSSSDGKPTGALYGLSSMLLRLIDDLAPDHLVACVDLPEKTHRHKVYDEYKATRMKAEPALVEQLNRAHEIFDAFGIPVFSAPGFEADDCIGTIAHELADREDIEVVIATGDYDTLQLVSGTRVKVYALRTGITDTVLFDDAKVRARFGFGPEHVSDYKGLRGDPSDNIPGIRGIGEKTATTLIEQFGSLESLYETLHKKPEAFEAAGIKPRIVGLLKDGEKDAVFSKMLATIRLDAPIAFLMPDRSWRETFDMTRLTAMFDALEFRSLTDRARLVFETGAALTPGVDVPDFSNSADVASAPLPEETLTAREIKETEIAVWLLRSDMTNPSPADVLRYTRAETMAEAREKVMKELQETGRLFNVFQEIERPLIPVVERMCRVGIMLDVDYLKKLSLEFHKELGEVESRIFQHVGHEFNINSPRQLAGVIFDELGIGSAGRIKKTATGQRSTREDELEKLSGEHPIIADVLEYRGRQKLLSTYVDALPALVAEDGRLHTTFQQAGSTTGRMSSQNPNLQNIPVKDADGRRVRRAFVAKKGYLLLAIDYSQIELRIAAGLSGDAKLIETFQQGRDIHTTVAAEVFGVASGDVTSDMRRQAKVINFGILYGMGANALRANLGDGTSVEDARTYLARYFETFSGLATYIEEVKQRALKTGYSETLFGRRRYFSGIESAAPQVRAQAERMAVNAPIQGTQSDIIKRAMVEADALIEKEGWREVVELVLQIHDELVYEVAETHAEEVADAITRVMEEVVTPADLSGVPIIVSRAIEKNLGALKK